MTPESGTMTICKSSVSAFLSPAHTLLDLVFWEGYLGQCWWENAGKPVLPLSTRPRGKLRLEGKQQEHLRGLTAFSSLY